MFNFVELEFENNKYYIKYTEIVAVYQDNDGVTTIQLNNKEEYITELCVAEVMERIKKAQLTIAGD